MAMPYHLDYLFIAETFNGNIIKQGQDDKPRFSNWGTICTDLFKEKIKKFSLYGRGHIFTLDLIDGHLEVDGNKLYPPKPPPGNIPLKLIYYRQVTQSINANYAPNSALSKVMGLVGLGKQYQPIVKYFIGWEYIDVKTCKNCKWELGIK